MTLEEYWESVKLLMKSFDRQLDTMDERNRHRDAQIKKLKAQVKELRSYCYRLRSDSDM